MPSTTPDGLVYPDSSGSTQIWTHIQNLADSTQTKFAAYEAWTSWTPVFTTGFTSAGVGGFMEGYYSQIGKLVFAHFRVQLAAGFTTTGAGAITLTMPVSNYVLSGTGANSALGSWSIRDESAVSIYAGTINSSGSSGTAALFEGAWTGSAPNSHVNLTGSPTTFAASDIFSGFLTYRAA